MSESTYTIPHSRSAMYRERGLHKLGSVKFGSNVRAKIEVIDF